MPKFSVKKPLTVFVAVLAILVLGVVAYLKMTPDLMPNMDFPYVILVTTDPGASPETVEADITKPLEQSMATLDRIKNVTSSSMDSVSMVVLEFEDGVNMDTVSVDIQQKINQLKGSWSDTVGDPYVLKMNPSMLPVQVAALSYDGKDITELSDFVTDTLSPKLEGITGVASVTVSGTVQHQLHVILSQKKLDDLSRRLSDAIAKQLDDAAGQLSSARGQVNSAKAAIRSAEESAVRDAVTQALTTIQDSLKTMRASRDQLQANLRELAEIQAEKARLEAENAPYQARIEAIRHDPSMTEEEKQAAIAEIESDPEYVRIQAELAALDLRMAALGVKWDEAVQRAKEWQKQLEELEKQLRDLETDEGVAKLADQVTAGTLTMADAVTQIISANIQLDSALNQIDQGLQTLEESRSAALSQADLSSSLNLSTITALLTAQNFSMPAGYLKEDGVNYMVSVGDAIGTRQDLEDLVLFDLGMDGIDPIRMKDVADVAITDNSSEIYDKLNGKDGVIVSFNKQSTYATAEVSDNINSRFRELEAEYEGLSFVPLMDQGDYIYLIINSILSSLGWGALFAVLILYLFLRDLRPTVITLCSIPISVIFAVVLMYFSGVTINMISLSGLAVAVGMLVDNSVVVIENIYRLRAKGATVIQAAVSGARQVLGAITASTLTTVCVFLPIVFVEGITKQLFTDLALTMTYSLLASLIVALTLVPAMASGMLRKEKPQKPGLLDRVYPAYRKAVSWSIHHKLVVLGVSLLLLVGSAGATLARGFAFMPNIDMNTVNLTVSMPEGCTREQAVSLADEVLRRAAQVENVETVGAMMSSSGSSGGMDMTSMMSSGGGAYDVTAYITLTEGASGAKTGQQIEAACTGMDCTVTASGAMDSYMTYLTGSGVALNVYGSDMEQMQSAAKTLAAKLATVPGTENVSDGLEQAATALHLSVDRNAAMEKGLTVAQVYMAVASALTDTDSSLSLTLDGLDVSVSIQSPEESRMTREKLMDLEIDPSAMSAMSSMMSAASGSGSMSGMSGMSSGSGSMSGMSGMSSGSTSAVQAAEPVRLGDIAKLEETVSLNTIHRDQQRRYITVSADVADGYNVTKVTTAAQAAIAEVDLPQGITASFQGENEAIMDAIEQLLLMLLLGIVLVYLVMVAQFQSLRSPLIVMFTIPLAFTGGFLALLLAGIEVSVVSLVGFVMLVGVIVNNGIVLVDYINQLRLEGMGRREAIIEAGVTRLRPILMTSLTTILGLVVMAFGKDVGTALMQPVALVCIGGLLYATLMTLLVVPCMYDILSRRDLRKVNEEELQLLDL
jgi:multidrug efflux pump subunit AcrB